MVGEDVTIVRASGAVPFGETRPASTTEIVVHDCLFAPLGTSEAVTPGQDVTTAQPTVYAPPGEDFRPTDRVRARGVLYDVAGVPQEWRSPWTGAVIGLAVPLRNVEG